MSNEGMEEREIKNFWDLKAWKNGNVLAIEIYSITKNFPDEEEFGLTSQLRRASISVTANIAEGFSRYYFKDKIRFYYQARGSISEIQSFIIFCKDSKIINENKARDMILKYNEVKKLINGLINSISRQG